MESRKRKNVSIYHLTITRRITRSMSLNNGRENSLPIPIDIIVMIFSRLSLKSIARCRCVSKLWAFILRRSDFTESFMSRSCSEGPKLLIAFRNESKLFFSIPQPQNPDEISSRVVFNTQMNFSISSGCKFENSDAVNGLICLKDERILQGKNESVLMICNPSTGQTLILPKVKTISDYWVSSLFGYDPIDKQFKILAMTKSGRHGLMCDEFHVLTLGSGNLSWKMIDCCIPHMPPCEKLCINGVLYYISIDWRTLVCFDILSEKFTFLEVMGTLKEVLLGKNANLINYNNKLALLQWYEGDRFVEFIRFKLWILQDAEKQEWSVHPFFFSNVLDKIDELDLFKYVGMTKKKEIVLLSRYSNFFYCLYYLHYLNLEKKTTKRVEIQGIDEEKVAEIFVDHVEDVKLYGRI